MKKSKYVSRSLCLLGGWDRKCSQPAEGGEEVQCGPIELEQILFLETSILILNSRDTMNIREPCFLDCTVVPKFLKSGK